MMTESVSSNDIGELCRNATRPSTTGRWSRRSHRRAWFGRTIDDGNVLEYDGIEYRFEIGKLEE
jgi:hypothetical protein